VAELTTHARTSKQIRRIGDMQGRLGLRHDAGKRLTVVAIGATADNARVVHNPSGESTGIGISRSVAVLARSAGRQMVHRFGLRRHPGKDLAVVASRATAGNARVVHDPRVIGRPMAQRANRSSRQVIGRFRASGRNRETHGRGMAAFARRGTRRSMGRVRRLVNRCHSNSKGLWSTNESVASCATADDAGVPHNRSRERYEVAG